MANSFYNHFATVVGAGNVNFPSSSITAVLADAADYTFSAAHDYYDDVPVAARVSEVVLTGKTTTGGVFDSSDVVFASVTGDPCEMVLLINDRGTGDANTQLLACYDTMTGLPVTPDGSNITLVLNASGWFSL